MVSAHIVWYLFLAGMGAGAFVVGAFVDFALRRPRSSRLERVSAATDAGLVLGPVLVLAGSLFLLADLGAPERVFHVLLAPPHGILGWGAWAIALFVTASVGALMAGRIARGRMVRSIEAVLQVLATVCALFVVGYSGVYLSLFPSVPFLNSPLVPCLFVASAFAAGFSLLTIGGAVRGERRAAELCVRGETACIVLELILLAAVLGVAWASGGAARVSAQILLLGRWAGVFWVGAVGAGLVAPGVFGVLSRHGSGVSLMLGAVLCVVGNLCMRYSLLLAAVRVSAIDPAAVMTIWG